MTEGVDTVLFDLDDTLCTYRRSADDILELAFERVGTDPFFDGAEYVNRLGEFSDAGDDIRDTRRASFGAFAVEAGHDRAVGHRIADIYTDERDQSNVRFVAGAERALEAVTDDYRVGMVTDGDPWMQSQKLDGLGIGDYFEVVVHGGHDAPYKPDPEPFNLAMDELDAAPETTVHVGNSVASDVRGALAAGLQSVWYANGSDVTEPDPRPHYVVESMAEVADEPWV